MTLTRVVVRAIPFYPSELEHPPRYAASVSSDPMKTYRGQLDPNSHHPMCNERRQKYATARLPRRPSRGSPSSRPSRLAPRRVRSPAEAPKGRPKPFQAAASPKADGRLARQPQRRTGKSRPGILTREVIIVLNPISCGAAPTYTSGHTAPLPSSRACKRARCKLHQRLGELRRRPGGINLLAVGGLEVDRERAPFAAVS